MASGNPNPKKKFTSETAYRGGGKAGRTTKANMFRTNAEILARQKGITPLELFIGMTNNEELPLDLRKAAGDSAAKYLHRALAPEPPLPPATPTTAQVLVYIPNNHRDVPPETGTSE